ncbi:hypothetical protein [uncultured Lactobacillus sp.]|uniref:hypothetical protein n=1 Tax=uncultured Lactobacillus sp. TaxID=153152 RepID=UPI0025DC6E70|nr:hypothetical protein [uncultured Lactobacillus sp.]
MPDGENGHRFTIHYTELKPGMYNSGNGYFAEEPYHYLKDIPFKKLESSNKIRKIRYFFVPISLINLFVVNQFLGFLTSIIGVVCQNWIRSFAKLCRLVLLRKQ